MASASLTQAEIERQRKHLNSAIMWFSLPLPGLILVARVLFRKARHRW